MLLSIDRQLFWYFGIYFRLIKNHLFWFFRYSLCFDFSLGYLLIFSLKKLYRILFIERRLRTLIFINKYGTWLVEFDVFVKQPMRLLISTLSPIFFKLTLTILQMFTVRQFIDQMIRIKQALFSHCMVF